MKNPFVTAIRDSIEAMENIEGMPNPSCIEEPEMHAALLRLSELQEYILKMCDKLDEDQ